MTISNRLLSLGVVMVPVLCEHCGCILDFRTLYGKQSTFAVRVRHGLDCPLFAPTSAQPENP